MPYVADRVKETTTTSGTGTITLAGAASGFRSFATAFGSSPVQVPYCVVDGTAWETGLGTFNGTTSLTRDVVYASSNSNNAISLSGGSSEVFCTAIAELSSSSSVGRQIATSLGWSLP